MYITDLKTTYFLPNKKYTFVIPMGSIEQHGPFLPLSCDTIIQDAIIERVNELCPEALYVPTLPITYSEEHAGFAGTVWLSEETMMLVMRDICNSLHAYADHIVLTSWHGGNVSLIDRFIEEHHDGFTGITLHHFRHESPEVIAKTEALLSGPVDEHAGNTEISMTLCSREDLVIIPNADYKKKKCVIPWESGLSVHECSTDGIIDNHPEWVIDKEQGRQCICFSAEHIAKELKRIMRT